MKRFLFSLVAAFVIVSTFAAPAYRKPFIVKQSDGTELTVILTGDEALHYYATADGKPLVKEVNGDYCYATFSGGAFVSTKCLAHNGAKRSAVENELLSSIDYAAMKADIAKVGASRSITYKAAAQKAGSQIEPIGDVNIAVLLVQFKDVKFTYTKEDINNILNTKDYVYENNITNSIGSARDYFIAQSDNKFRPNFIVADIVTMDNNMAYYGGNDNIGNDLRAPQMIKEGIAKADAAGYDFSVCDNDGDGEVEFIYCIYAGYSESYGADANTIWPHQWQLSAEAGSIRVDGVKCDTYACSGELVYNEELEPKYGRTLAGIGLICHEFSHCLGLHDIYDTTYESGNWGMDYWDVMDQGNYAAEGYVPVGYSAYQRDFCGWRELVEINEKGSYSMLPLTQGGQAYKIVNDANRNEYYILENRKQEGWDSYLFGSGMLVIHVDYLKSAWDNNEINTTKNHPRYTLIPADNKLDVYGEVETEVFVESLKGDVWPGTSGNTKLTNSSLPAAKTYAGSYMNKPITDITYQNDIISFNFMYGIFAGVPQALSATDVTETSFVANWEALDGAEEYAVELYKITETAAGSGDLVSLLEEDFLGVTAVKANTDITSDINKYTTVNGWSGEKIYGEGMVIRVGTSQNPGSLTTPALEANGAVSVDFSTTLYNVNDNNSVLTVLLKEANGEIIAEKSIELTSKWVNGTVTANIDGQFYVEFNTKKSTGKKRAKLDNIIVKASSATAFEKVETVVTSALMHKFDELEKGGKYRYRVQARDEYASSDFSQYVDVALSTTSIDKIQSEDSWVNIYSIAGVKVYSGESGCMPELVKGVYIAVTASGVHKIVVE